MSKSIQLHDLSFQPYLSESEIQLRIKEMGRQISEDYHDKKPLFIGILNGAFMFTADLAKACPIDADFAFVRLQSYEGTASSGEVITMIGLKAPVEGRHLILVEDIIDTGRTLHTFLPQLKVQHPASVRIAALLSKPEARVKPLQADYTGFEIPNKFVVGYGLDYNELGRNLPAIYQLED
ncbi:MAG: hypoxanthine phosphoribosyltransferase [Phaeodactylibacter sp.]|nr:hypoxanthine phosphoribosyltransferase [Phaeodactylibacter sp.]